MTEAAVSGVVGLSELLGLLDTLAILDGVVKSEAAGAVLGLLRVLEQETSTTEQLAVAYGRAFGALARSAHTDTVTGIADAWQAHLVVRLIEDENPWSAQAERVGPDGVSAHVRSRVEYELRILHRLFEVSSLAIAGLAAARARSPREIAAGAWEPWLELAGWHAVPGILASYTDICRSIAGNPDWGKLSSSLERYWRGHGAGPLTRFRSLQWLGRDGGLQGVAYPDRAELADLFGYESQHRLLRRNTERFLSGLPAHDALLYGRPGTGKSSTVKALASEYADQGLRLLELPKEAFFDLPIIMRLIRERGSRYLLFIDDLSFEENQAEYKALKVLLEGAVEARPPNLLVYATTNRLNLIREQFRDRGSRADDVHWRDTMDEKVSLGERFGLRVTFHAPDTKAYLSIAAGLAARRGIALPEAEIHARALRWANQHQNTRSGRLARQFVDELQAEISESDAPDLRLR